MRSVVLASTARPWVWSVFGTLVLLCGVATSSRAELTGSIDAGATLGLSISNLDPISIATEEPVAATASRDEAYLLTTLGFSEEVFKTTGFTVPVTDPGAFPISGVQATIANGPASFVRDENGKLGGLMPLIGVAKVCLFGPCSGSASNLTVPVDVVGGTTATTLVTGAVNLTVKGAPWTQGTLSIGGVTAMGNTAQNATTGGGFSNVVSLVTPIYISTNIAVSSVVPAFGLLNFTLLTSAPEPGAIAAFGAALISLIAVGFRRRR